MIAIYLSMANMVLIGTVMMFLFIYKWVKALIESATIDTVGYPFRDPIR